MKFDDEIRYSMLLALYGNMLTQNKREFCEDYYYKNLGYSEQAEMKNVSRQAVHDAVNKSRKLLDKYEERLGFLKKCEKISQMRDNVTNRNTKKVLTDVINEFIYI